MPISSRIYLFDADGPKPVVKRTIEGLIAGTDALPQYAESRQRVAYVTVENEAGKPVRIVRATGAYWTFDEEGHLDRSFLNRAADALDFLQESPAEAGDSVVDIKPQLRRKKWEREHQWELSKDELDRIAADVWPSEDGPPKPERIVGTAPKRPPLTREAKSALREIESALYKISSELEDLSEPALKGLGFEAGERAAAGDVNAAFWAGLAKMADRRREILARHRDGRGKWFAVIESTTWEPSRRSGRITELAHEECRGKKAAEEAARRLLAENAKLFTGDTSVEARIYCDLEWAPDRGLLS